MQILRCLRPLVLMPAILLSLLAAPALAQIPDLKLGRVPTLAPLVKEVTPAVVNISVEGKVRQDNPLYQDPLFRDFFDVPKQVEKQISATGSGVIVDAARGYVMTANHVVEHVTTAQIRTKDGRKFSARLVGRDPATDIALLQIKDPTELKAIAMGDSDALEVGDFVIAVGNPFGLGQTVTSGLVSALGRTGLGKQGYEDFIQTDAAINPGNSGGALINLRGELVGINTAIISPGGGNVGIGFAVPINMARRVMEQLVANGRVDRGRIGVTLLDLDSAADGRVVGARVADVSVGSPAERAGLRKGDIIVKANDMPVRSATQVRNLIGLTPVGQRVRLVFERDRALGNATVEVAPIAEERARMRTSG
ncbi:Periplasmic serine endoprotease DegP [Bradyrhizobium sp. ORS 285]|uniref:trypsin-like peptidase domain-containing protein n=1 Tax=Bradyrhizobium sp. ORS 285 TaxID=115808 RepID=UPI0002409571|nr:trypsin-like peptidase domain-containing protein [Bradyrhizobium sp. ORS 285]CCD89238.1 Serine protease do-like precursor [Bradyrhizobium sp. ORS 285]SMX59495.1 Periplasmic serine endoprotease DegP [Bradyrhizobium sp. ORS 285]